jgi:6-phosphofructo-2-kinase/fructose-2,6-biphosphatase 4
MAAELYKTVSGRKYHAGKIGLVLVGLPARGKTFIARHLSKFLQWLGVKTRTFSVTHYRRTHFGVQTDPSFYDPGVFKLYSRFH